MDKVVVRFKRPSGTSRTLRSQSLHRALVSLAEADEFQSMLGDAMRQEKALTIEVFESREGVPILIHFGKERL